jgi:predicted flap endonuclease-1-like 5' DNA nuclease
MAYRLSRIEGIGAVYAAKLGEAGLATTDDLLEAAARPKGRATLAERTGIPETLILKWANRADLMRISGISEEISDLLEAAGVDTVPDLKRRRADHLAEALRATNEKKKLVRRVPGEAQCARFIEDAKALPRVMSY